MKTLRLIIRLIILLIFVVIAFYLWNFLQKEEVIVLNDTKTVIEKLRAISKLETAEVTISKTMSAESQLTDYIEWYSFDNIIQDLLFQDKMNFSLTWRVVAWIDLEKIETWDIRKNLNWSIRIKLPEAEILYVIIDENAIPQREIWLLTKWNANMETELRNEAKRQMEQEAIEAWILDIANEKANEVLAWLLSGINVVLSNDYSL